ncbi:hypothetical protein J121_460 [Qipengyuania citrea LAMA 915]|uniref:DUF899 domain-containing protein n=1 Tax=Qipengyuania citrea LAMA 915 TaxID=1306953 RepID=A0A0L1KI92_9SPHN|nr:hypothetical protein J121_460 [Qipengyuania citrea LAMA 915]
MFEEEQAFAKQRNALISKRRELPVTQMEDSHHFEGPDGEVRLIDMFGGERQLLVYHFWFEPGEEPCQGCSAWTRDLGNLGGNFASLRENDTALTYVSRASANEIADVKRRRSWTMPWYSLIGDGFEEATGFDGWAQISIFLRDGNTVYLANVVPFDDLVNIGNHWTLLDRAPIGISKND